MQKSHVIYEYDMVTYESDMLHINESCHVSMSHGTQKNESCHISIYEWGMSHMNASYRSVVQCVAVSGSELQ